MSSSVTTPAVKSRMATMYLIGTPSSTIWLIRLRDTFRCAAKDDARPRSAEIHV